MIFRLIRTKRRRVTHCKILSSEGELYVPNLIQYIGANKNWEIQIQNLLAGSKRF